MKIAESIRVGRPGPDSLFTATEAIADICHRLAARLPNQAAAEFSRLSQVAERAAAAPSAARLQLLRARFARACFAAADAGQMAIPDVLRSSIVQATRPSDGALTEFSWIAAGVALTELLARELPGCDPNPLGLIWRDADREQPPRVALPRSSKDKSAPDYLELVKSALLQHHQPTDDWRSLGCWDPAKQSDILRALNLRPTDKGRVSEVFKLLFGSHQEYAHRCRRQSPELLRILQRAAGETPDATGAEDRIDGLTGGDQDLQDLLLDMKSSYVR